ncbi:MAG TPA: hypothetical protein PKB02_12200 [Anaerohalosphaeraceae bacterium]|nr:hypothetical protein [Anaerohalosphaeraceae bacterium]
MNRINCNEFVQNLNEDHNFTMGHAQDIIAIRRTIPAQYLLDFEAGLNL